MISHTSFNKNDNEDSIAERETASPVNGYYMIQTMLTINGRQSCLAMGPYDIRDNTRLNNPPPLSDHYIITWRYMPRYGFFLSISFSICPAKWKREEGNCKTRDALFSAASDRSGLVYNSTRAAFGLLPSHVTSADFPPCCCGTFSKASTPTAAPTAGGGHTHPFGICSSILLLSFHFNPPT